MHMRIRRTLAVFALALLGATSVAAQHFASDEDLTELIRSRVEAGPERTQVVVAEDILESYVGEYELAPTFSIFVTLEDGALFAQATGQGRAPIFPESETEFFYRVVDAQLSFTKDDSGVVTGLILHQGGANQPGQKVR